MGRFTQSALLKALGWSLFDSLWQMALLWLCFVLLVSVFSKMAARSRHGLAFLLISIGAGAFVLSFITHYAMSIEGSSEGPWGKGLLLTPEQAGYALPAIARQIIDPLLPYCSTLYLLALAFLFTRYTYHYVHSSRLKLEGLSRINPALRLFVTQTAGRMGIKKEVRVWLSSLVEGPVTLGFLRPVILMPFATVNNLSLEQVEAILLHELAHIKRYDWLLNLGMTFLQLLFFFNPFTRLLLRQIRTEREHCCDDLVMQFRYDPREYASALLSLARAEQRRLVLALAATGKNDYLLLQRVKRILKQENKVDRPGTGSVVCYLFTVLTVFLTLSHPGVPARMIARNKSAATAPAAIRMLSLTSVSKTATPLPATPITAPIKKTLVPGEKRRVATSTADCKEPSPAPVGQEDQQEEQELVIPPDHPPLAISFQTMRISPMKDTTLSGRLLAALTDEESSAREVKSRIAKAIAANAVAIRKAEAMNNSGTRALRELPSDTQQPELLYQRQSMEEQLRSQRQILLMQQDLQKRLESAMRKLAIVYI